MQDFREGRLKRAGQLGFCLACDVEITQAPQSNVAIGLNGDGLIEFWSEGKTHFEDVAGAQLVTPAPPLKNWPLYFWTATPVGPRHPEHSSLGANAEGPRHLGPCREEDDQIDVRPDWRTCNSKNKCTSHTDVDSVAFSAVADPAFVLPREGNRRL